MGGQEHGFFVSRRLITSFGFLTLLVGHGVPASAQVPTWRLEPSLQIGEAFEEDYALSPVGGLAVDREGRVYVGQPMDRLLRVYSDDGAHLRNIGRRGEGPGEIRNLSTFAIVEDSLWVADLAQDRVTWFSLEGEVLGTRRWFIRLEEGQTRPGVPEAMLASGHAVASPKVQFSGASEADPGGLPVYLVDPDLQVRKKLFTVDSEKRFLLMTYEGGRMVSSYQPLSDTPLSAPLPDGSGLVVLQRPAPGDGTRHSFRATIFDVRGDSVAGWSVSFSPRPVTDDQRSNYIQNAARRIGRHPGGGPAPAPARDLAEEALYLPAYHPPVSKMFVGTDGTIWLRRERKGAGSRHRWEAYTTDGRRVGRVSVSDDLRVEAATREALWAVRRTAAGVPTVVRLEIRQDRTRRPQGRDLGLRMSESDGAPSGVEPE